MVVTYFSCDGGVREECRRREQMEWDRIMERHRILWGKMDHWFRLGKQKELDFWKGKAMERDAWLNSWKEKKWDVNDESTWGEGPTIAYACGGFLLSDAVSLDSLDMLADISD